MNYYNEWDKYAAQWLRNLISAGLIPAGDVDERSIADVKGSDLRGYTQCHFFAGLGGWSRALELAGWESSRAIWTGSCPCQPYSVAGKRKGNTDSRDLWPEFYRLIRECNPAVVFGEQVASSDVVGKPLARGEEVQQMLDRQAVFSVLSNLQRSLAESMQGVREREAQFLQESYLLGEETQRSWLDIDSGGQIQSIEDRSAFHFGRNKHSATNRERTLRADRREVRPEDTQSLELPLIGSNNTARRLHDGEHQSSDLRSECDGSQLGSELDLSCCGFDQGEAQGELERLVATYRREVEEESVQVWLSRIQSDLGRISYSTGASVISAASVGAPHIRQRLFWVAERDGGLANTNGRESRDGDLQPGREYRLLAENGGSMRLAHTECDPRDARRPAEQSNQSPGEASTGTCLESGRRGLLGDGCCLDNPHFDGEPCRGGCPRLVRLVHTQSEQARLPGQPRQSRGADTERLGNAECARSLPGSHAGIHSGEESTRAWNGEPERPGFWDDFDIVHCIDGKARRTGSGIFPLAHGIPARVGKLRAAGNAIVPEAAAEFIKAYLY